MFFSLFFSKASTVDVRICNRCCQCNRVMSDSEEIEEEAIIVCTCDEEPKRQYSTDSGIGSLTNLSITQAVEMASTVSS